VLGNGLLLESRMTLTSCVREREVGGKCQWRPGEVSVRWRSRQSAASRGARALTGCLITGAAAARKAAGPCCVSVRQGGSVCELRGEAERGARVRARRRAAAS